MSEDQNTQLFSAALQKIELEKQLAQDQAKAKMDSDWLLAEEEAKLKRELMREESQARIKALSTTQASLLGSSEGGSKEDSTDKGEIPEEICTHSLRFANLPQEEIVRIFNGKFKPVNLYKLRHMKGQSYEVYYDQEKLGIKNGQIRVCKTHGTYKDYGKSIHEVWSKAFLNYQTILVTFFGKMSPDLHAATSQFYPKISELLRVYHWELAVLLLIIDIHTHITTIQLSVFVAWTIPKFFIARFCNSGTTISNVISLSTLGTSTSSKRKRDTSETGSKSVRTPRGATNNLFVICKSFNSAKKCNFSTCEKSHTCKECGSKGHNLQSCTRVKTVKPSWEFGAGNLIKLVSDRIILQDFLENYFCLPAPERPNTTLSFQLVDAFKLFLYSSLLPFNLSAWAALLVQYPGHLRYYLLMIFCFGTQRRYQGNKVFLLSKNLISALQNFGKIDKKIITDLAFNQIAWVMMSAFPFISSPLNLVPNSNGGLQPIHHLSHPGIWSINAQISKKANELSYTII